MNTFKLKICCVVLLSCLSLKTVGQGNLMKQADEKFDDFKYFEAIDLYKEVVDKKKKNANDAYVKLAQSYYRTSQYKQAAFWYKKAIDSNKGKPELKLSYAQALMSNGEYSEALKWFEAYKADKPGDTRTVHFINWCKNIPTFLADSSKYQIKKLAFNSKAHDFSPVFFDGGLVFTSDRVDSEKSSLGQDDIYTDLFFVEHNSGAKWSNAELLKGKVQGKYHDGPSVFTKDGQTMYFTRNVKHGKRNRKSGKSTNVLKIYQATWNNGKWDNIKELPFCSSDNSYSVSHPALSKDGRTMIFTSDKAGGKGGMDLYIVKKDGDTWGGPKNLGSEVNSEGNEVFPTIHEDGTLYFSSNGWGGFGGLDIFSTNYQNNKWGQATNMGFPINGPNDDSGLMLAPNKQLGYFASNRMGGKGFDDIYELFITQDKAVELLADKSLIVAPTPIQSSASVNKKVEAEPKQEIPLEVEKQAVAIIPEKEMKPKKEGSDKADKNDKNDKNDTEKSKGFTSKDEVNVFVPKNEDVAIGKVFYLLGSVVEYGKDSKKMSNAVVEILNHTDNSKQVHYADQEGHFYLPLTLGHDYTVVHTSQGEIHDFKKVDTKDKDSSEITHVILRGKKPLELKQYVKKIYDKEVAVLATASTQTVQHTTPTKTYANTTNMATTTNKATYVTAAEPTFFDNYGTASIVYKVQVGSFKRDIDVQSNYFKNVNDSIEKETGPNNLKRYLVGNYTNYSEAKKRSQAIKNLGLDSSFVAVYINGVRQEQDAETILKQLGIQP